MRIRKDSELAATTAELEQAKIAYVIDQTKGGHYKVRWQANGQGRLLVCSCTGGDRRGALNARALTRRMLRADGLIIERSDHDK